MTKPAVVFCQYSPYLGAFRILLSVKGSEVVLEDLAPKILEIQDREFPGATIMPWCDPTGAKGNGGMLHTPVRLLRNLGVPALYEPTANSAEVRYAAILALSGFMRRTAVDGSPAFQMHPRCIELEWRDGALVERETQLMVTAFMTGYVWGEAMPSDVHPNIRKPKKGTRYDDLMNACEYVVIGEKIGAPVTQQEREREKQRLQRHGSLKAVALRQEQGRETIIEMTERLARENRKYRDHEPADQRWGRGRFRQTGSMRRGGW